MLGSLIFKIQASILKFEFGWNSWAFANLLALCGFAEIAILTLVFKNCRESRTHKTSIMKYCTELYRLTLTSKKLKSPFSTSSPVSLQNVHPEPYNIRTWYRRFSHQHQQNYSTRSANFSIENPRQFVGFFIRKKTALIFRHPIYTWT